MITLGLAGCGALGSILARELIAGMPGMRLIAISEIRPVAFDLPVMNFADLAEACDIVLEALPPNIVPELAREVLPRGKQLWMLSAAALLRFPEIMGMARLGQIQISAGALAGMDAVRAFAYRGIQSAKLISTKPPHALAGAPYVMDKRIDLNKITQAECIFTGNAASAARAFPANTNVGATLAIGCMRPGDASLFPISVEIWADPDARGNTHKIWVQTRDGGEMTSEIFSLPSPDNPKSSPQAAYTMLAQLRQFSQSAL